MKNETTFFVCAFFRYDPCYECWYELKIIFYFVHFKTDSKYYKCAHNILKVNIEAKFADFLYFKMVKKNGNKRKGL